MYTLGIHYYSNNIHFMKKKKTFLILCLGLINAPLQAQTIQHVDAWKYGNGYNPSSGLSLALDNNQNTISIGTFGGQVDFDKGSSTLMMTAQNNNGQSDMFIMKSNPQGEVIWAKNLKVDLFTDPIIEFDSQNNMYIAATWFYTLNGNDFDPWTRSGFPCRIPVIETPFY